MHDLGCIVLCAGQGTRMKTKRPKVLHEAAGKALYAWSLDWALALKANPIQAVLGYEKEQVREGIENHYGKQVQTVVQDKQRGTGHAVQVAFENLAPCKRVLVLYGDTPLLTLDTLKALCLLQENTKSEISMLTAYVKNPFGYGRIVRDNNIKEIIEERNASAEQKEITEINPGIYVFDYEFLKAGLANLKPNEVTKELYLTDLIAQAQKPIGSIEVSDKEIVGVNDMVQLAKADRLLRRRINEEWMREGVEMLDYKTTYIDSEVKLSPGVVLEQGVILRGACEIGPGVRIGAYSVLQDAKVGENSIVGPFARLRPGAVLESDCKIGNFVEVKKSHFGKGSKASHLAYIGDAEIGEACNIGAGTITCNYDGQKKHKTKIDNGVFVGSNATLVAPLHLGDSSYVGAGSVINQDVPAKALGLGRARQENKKDWVKK